MAYSDYHGSDSDSGEGADVYHRSPHPHKLKSKAPKVSRNAPTIIPLPSEGDMLYYD